MEISLKGSAYELKTFFVMPGTSPPTVVGDPLPPPIPPPPPACAFSEAECTTLKNIAGIVASAPSGALFSSEDGTLVVVGPWTQKATSVYDPSTGTWSAGAWPP